MSLVLPSEPGPVLVNKGELAGILGITVATLSAWIAKHPDFPVYERGTQGREWRFDAGACVAFVAAIQAAGRAEEAERAGRAAQLGLPLVDPGDAAGAAGFDLADLKRARLADQVRAERAFLVEAGAVAEALASAIARWDARVAKVLTEARQTLDLPEAAVQGMADGLAEARRRFAAEAADGLGMPGGGPMGRVVLLRPST